MPHPGQQPFSGRAGGIPRILLQDIPPDQVDKRRLMLAELPRAVPGIVRRRTSRTAAAQKLRPALGKGCAEAESFLSLISVKTAVHPAPVSDPDSSGHVPLRNGRFLRPDKGRGLKEELIYHHRTAPGQGFPLLPDRPADSEPLQDGGKIKIVVVLLILFGDFPDLLLRKLRILPDALRRHGIRLFLILSRLHGEEKRRHVLAEVPLSRVGTAAAQTGQCSRRQEFRRHGVILASADHPAVDISLFNHAKNTAGPVIGLPAHKNERIKEMFPAHRYFPPNDLLYHIRRRISPGRDPEKPS